MSTASIAGILSRTVEVGECLEWTGAFTNKGTTPSIRWDGKVDTVRRVLWKLIHGPTIDPAYQITCRCKNVRCVAPAHLHMASRHELSALAAKSRNQPLASARISLTICKRRSIVSDDLVSRIRQDARSSRVIARETGLSPSYVSDLKLWKKRKNATLHNPFLQLIRPGATA